MNENNSITLSGSCLCSKVSFIIHQKPLDMLNCFCSMCRKSHGAVFATWLAIEEEALVFEHGKEELKIFASSKNVNRFFCRECGSSMFWKSIFAKNTKENAIWVAAALVEGDLGIKPQRDIFTFEKPPWLTLIF